MVGAIVAVVLVSTVSVLTIVILKRRYVKTNVQLQNNICLLLLHTKQARSIVDGAKCS